jgi:sarcosine oxidase
MTNSYDAIVLGTGGVGSAALFHLARRGLRVLGIDRFPDGHDRGSSHGDTRIIRQAYFEHPDYVPLLLRAYELWAELEQRTRQKLLHEVGLLQVGPSDGVVIPGVLASAQQHGLSVEQLNDTEVSRRFPGFRAPQHYVGLLEKQAGYLLVERCVLAHLEEAKKLGAEQIIGESAQAWRSSGSGFELQTDRATYRAQRLIVTPGAWAPELLASLGVPFQVRRKQVFWLGPASPHHQAGHGCPTFLFELPGHIFYGFPALDAQGLKVAEHSGGEVVSDPLHDARVLDSANLELVQNFVSEFLPGMGHSLQKRSVCFYTMTPDEHFVVDRHPEQPSVVFAAGLSGHGFKFTSVLGEALAELTLEGRTALPIGFLGLHRPTLR